MLKLFLLQLVLFAALIALYVAVGLHLDGSDWGYSLLAFTFVERVFRIVRIHYKSNGRTWYEL